eukprot:scaffold104423_cov33-Tisochrysis_lutea.AAC.2
MGHTASCTRRTTRFKQISCSSTYLGTELLHVGVGIDFGLESGGNGNRDLAADGRKRKCSRFVILRQTAPSQAARSTCTPCAQQPGT